MSKWVLLFSLIMLSPSQVTGQVTADAHDSLMTITQATVASDAIADPFNSDSDLDGSMIAPTLALGYQRAVGELFSARIAFLPAQSLAGPQIRAPPYSLFA